MTPGEAEMTYLNTAKLLDLYGVDIHTVMVSTYIVKRTTCIFLNVIRDQLLELQ